MSPKRIRLILAGNNTGRSGWLFERLRTDPLMEICGEYASLSQLARATDGVSADVAVVELAEDADCEEPAAPDTGIKLVGIAPAGGPPESLKPLLHSCVAYSADQRVSADDIYARLKYQIKNARLAVMVQTAGVKGKWVELPERPAAPVNEAVAGDKYDLIVLGASAGGTNAIHTVLSALPVGMPPIVAVQHMPRDFVGLFVSHLSERCRLKMCLATGGERLERGTVYFTAEDKHLAVARVGDAYYAECRDGEKTSGHRPSVDELFYSAAEAAGSRAIGVILTGMGADGAEGLLRMRRSGAYTLGQDEASCAVYGMPAAAYRLGAVERQLPLGSIGEALIAAASQNEGR